MWLKLTIPVLLLAGIYAQENADGSCTPGTKWKKDCNECECTESGEVQCEEWVCLQKDPDPPVNKLGTPLSAAPCFPGNRWRKDCNLCFCSENRVAICTRKACAPPQIQGQKRYPDGTGCSQGERWKEECNDCWCGVGGRVMCTRRGCISRPIPDRRRTDRRCIPGRRWKIDCNDCWCTDQGQTMCTRRGCLPPPGAGTGGRAIERTGAVETKRCVPGAEWKEDCNDCVCNEEGLTTCTKRECLPGPTQSEDGSCIPGARWKKECNDCWCTDDGTTMCTRVGCGPRPGPPPLDEDGKCIPGATWKDDCNDCFCNSVGYAECTYRGCLPEGFEIDNTDDKCLPGSSWKEDCNDCVCNSAGVADCTYRGCLSTEIKSECTPGTKWKMDCNDCFCNRVGIAQCTYRGCLSGPSEPDDGKCLPGARWKVDCNDCWCTDAGVAACTLRGCLEHEIPLPIPTDQVSRENCTPGDTWKIECNNCMCTENGVAVCTRKACRSPPLLGERTAPVPEIEPCNPGEKWNDGCNDCFCTENGRTMCTYRACLPAPVSPPDASDSCLPGNRWKSDCNDCWCSDEGTVMCTRKQCPAPPKKDCEPGEMWEEGCNRCRCTATGLTICTKRTCGPQVKGRTRAFTAEAACTPGMRWNDGCNDCWCTADATTMCTRRACLPPRPVVIQGSPPPGEKCTPGDKWNDGCNDCWCTQDGTTMCTRMACLPSPNQPDNTCTPGTRWKDDCNSCWCSEDRTSMCTRLACRPGSPPAATPKCTPGEKWNDGCNDCWCTKEAVTMCTRRACLPAETNSTDTCVPGNRWNDGCNICQCTEDKVTLCTQRACLPAQTEYQKTNPPPSGQCTPGEKWNDGCNDCWCTDDAVTICTRRACLPAPEQSEETCLPGTKWNDGCNDCWCTDDATTMCTRLACSPGQTAAASGSPPSTDPCAPGENWNDGCNECQCTNHSVVVCTQRACLPVRTQPLSPCNPGDKWNDGCNDCWCTVDAVTMCTRMACLPADPVLRPYHRICYDPPIRGRLSCMAYNPRWTFNLTSGQCERYIYGGCGGTDNLFATEQACKDRCHLRETPKSRDVCLLPKSAGPCRAKRPVFGYNQLTQRCELFFYGGCKGNENRFQSPSECRKICGGLEPNTDPDCRSDRCDWYAWSHYLAKQCKPVFKNNACCPTSFDCSEWDRVKNPEKCYYRGRLYDVGVDIPEVTERIPCMILCRCMQGHSGRAEINCVNVECPEDLGTPNFYPGCKLLYQPGDCCARNYSCPRPPTIPPEGESQEVDESEESEEVKRKFYCQVDGKQYSEGERFYPKAAICKVCTCVESWREGINGPACRDIDCGLELRRDYLFRNCVPIYLPNNCCPIDFHCPEEKLSACEDYECPQEEECFMQEVQCVKAPCPPIPACRPIEKSHTCDGHECGEGEECFLKDVQCVKAPCLPIPACRPKDKESEEERDVCEDHKCPLGDECYVRALLCDQPPCPVTPACRTPAPNCNSSWCPEGMDCYMKDVQCVREPCPKVPACRPAAGGICNLPAVVGPCHARIRRFFYNSDSKECEKFYYGGCRGNRNKFKSASECQRQCKPVKAKSKAEVCSLPKSTGPCRASKRRFYFNSQTKTCEKFIYGGCDGNANKFQSQKECIDFCDARKEDGRKLISKDRVCSMFPNNGPCRGRKVRYYFDTRTRSCRIFYYSGCQGNANNFKTLEACENKCGDKRQIDKCSLPKVVGHCLAYFPSYFFNVRTKRCEKFIYGGCQGNSNRFHSKEECMNECRKSPEFITRESKCLFGSAVYYKDERMIIGGPCNLCACTTPPTPSCFKLQCSPPPTLMEGRQCSRKQEEEKCCPEFTCIDRPVVSSVPASQTSNNEMNPCNDLSCAEGEVCISKAVQCVVAPCPPIGECVPLAGSACEDYSCDGKCFLTVKNIGDRPIPECMAKPEVLCAIPFCPGCPTRKGPAGCPVCDCSNRENINPCDSSPCEAGAKCESNNDGTEFVCIKRLTCADLNCPPGEKCEMKEVQCAVAPCPTPQCVPE